MQYQFFLELIRNDLNKQGEITTDDDNSGLNAVLNSIYGTDT